MTGAGDHHEDDTVLAAEHVLGLLEGEDLARAERRLESDAEYRALHALWTEAAALAAAWVRWAAALAAGTYLVVTNLDLMRSEPVGPGLRAEIAAEDGSLVVQVAYDPADPDALQISRPSGAAAPGRALELWLIAGEAAPVSLGVLPEDRDGRVAVPEALRPLLAQAVLAVSDEPEGGSPTKAPTGAVLGAGPVTTL